MISDEQLIVRADAVEAGDHLAVAEGYPARPDWTVMTEETAELLGLLCADGWVDRGGGHIWFTNNDDAPDAGGQEPVSAHLGRARSEAKPS